MNKFAVYYGDQNLKAAEKVKLNAGPLSLIFQDGIIKSIRFGEQEIIQRIYMALRDKYWNTISHSTSIVKLETSPSSFHIIFKTINRHSDIHFLWRGEITGSIDGTIYYFMHGEAISTFQRNRIGLCVLHPLELCVGRACTIESIDGTVQQGTFPVFISPFQPFTNIKKISYRIPTTGIVSIRFEGDTFEMEDQRNWTDASFKTYSTPLSNPVPVTIKQGSIIEQSVTIKITDHKCQMPPIKYPKAIEIKIPDQNRFHHPIPLIGVCHNSCEQLNPFSIEMLHHLSLSHLRIEIQCENDSEIISEMENAAILCSQLGTTAELALHFTENYETEIQMVSKVLRTSQIPVTTFLIYRSDLAVTPAETISAVLPFLYSYAPSALVGGGTDSHFVNINRQHPNTDLLDLICYSANPQVHTSDNDSVMTNLAGLAETLRTATLFQGKAHTAISPLSLKPRFNKTRPQKFINTDPRQQGLFGASWTLGSLMHCIEGGVKSITLFETVGDAGLMAAIGTTVYPLYHVIASFREFKGAIAQSCICNNPNYIASIALVSETSIMLLVANLTDIIQQVTIFDLPETITFVSLNENTFEEATAFAYQWRCKKGIQVTATGPFHIFDILPYAILRIEAPII